MKLIIYVYYRYVLAADDDMKVNVILLVQLGERRSSEREDGASKLPGPDQQPGS